MCWDNSCQTTVLLLEHILHASALDILIHQSPPSYTLHPPHHLLYDPDPRFPPLEALLRSFHTGHFYLLIPHGFEIQCRVCPVMLWPLVLTGMAPRRSGLPERRYFLNLPVSWVLKLLTVLCSVILSIKLPFLESHPYVFRIYLICIVEALCISSSSWPMWFQLINKALSTRTSTVPQHSLHLFIASCCGAQDFTPFPTSNWTWHLLSSTIIWSLCSVPNPSSAPLSARHPAVYTDLSLEAETSYSAGCTI